MSGSEGKGQCWGLGSQRGAVGTGAGWACFPSVGSGVARCTGPRAEGWPTQEGPARGDGGEMGAKTLPGLWDLPVRFVSRLCYHSFQTHVGVGKPSG